MTHLLAPLLGFDLGIGSVPARSLLQMAKKADYENILPIAIRVVVVGALIASLRKLGSRFFSWLDRTLWPTAYIAVTDASYLWVMAWLAQDPAAQGQIRDFQLSTSEWREVRQGSGNALHVETQKGLNLAPSSPTVGEHNASWSAENIIGQMTPIYHQSIRIKHGKTTVWVTRKVTCFAGSVARSVDHIQIRTQLWQKSALKDFLSAAHGRYFTKQDSELLIFHPGRIAATWQKPVSRPSRPWSSVILPGTVKEVILADVEKFLSEKEIAWYAARGIPHRRGYLLHGSPGSGKTTLVTAIASSLRLNIYVVNPSQRGMDDAKLSKLFRDAPSRSILLIEDIDCIFPTNQGRGTLLVTAGEDSADAASAVAAPEVETRSSSPQASTGSHDLAPSTVTLSGLLNAIDGVSSQEGCLLFASTNHPEQLDPALTRVGRFDVKVPFFHATSEQAVGLFKHFYPIHSPTDSANLTDEKKLITSDSQLVDLATQFTDAVFPSDEDPAAMTGAKRARGVSMAALQGYLLGHKDDPFSAIEGARIWAEGLCEEKVTRKVLTLAPAPAGKAKGATKKKAVQTATASPAAVQTPMSAGTV